jgi:hypothetical protein
MEPGADQGWTNGAMRAPAGGGFIGGARRPRADGRHERRSAARLAVPGQELVDAFDRMVGDSSEHVAQVGLRVEAGQLRGLCRTPNYAERACFPQDLP